MAEVAHAAHQALANDRVHTTENITKLVEKKREMFRIQMMIDLKKEEIDKLETFALVREDGLKKSESMLNEDIEHLQKFWEKCKRDSHNAMKNAEDASKRKIKKQQKLNKINDDIQSVTSNIQKNDELMTECLKYKRFLDKLSTVPEEDTRLNFENPAQLMELFANLVEENLFLIQITQEQEQEIEATKHEILNLQYEMDEQMIALRKARDDSLRDIEEKTKRCNALQQRLGQSNDNEQKEMPALKKLEEMIAKVFTGSEGDEGQQNCLTMLSDIEKNIDNYLRIFAEVRSIDRNVVDDFARRRKDTRRDEYREKAIENENKRNVEKALKYKERSENPKARVFGKPIMRRYRPKEKQVKKKEVKVDQEEQDRREFLD
mmetsp:Transcript_7150/g.13087  ORF Transcript_7150/g.13087 Transcript_7150/m.13087 type:complete len:377 (-) Transcript_7150:35-1165(-)